MLQAGRSRILPSSATVELCLVEMLDDERIVDH